MTDYPDRREDWQEIDENTFKVAIYIGLAVHCLHLFASLSSLLIVAHQHKRKDCFLITIPVLSAMEAIAGIAFFVNLLLQSNNDQDFSIFMTFYSFTTSHLLFGS